MLKDKKRGPRADLTTSEQQLNLDSIWEGTWTKRLHGKRRSGWR